MLNKRHISQPSRQFVDDPEWGVAVTAVLGAGSCFAIQVSLWGLGRLGSSGQAVIRLFSGASGLPHACQCQQTHGGRAHAEGN